MSKNVTIIKKDLAKRIIEVKELDSYISTVVDYNKEEEYSNKYDEVVKDLQNLNYEFINGDIKAILNIVEEEKNYYIYDKDEIIEVLFPLDDKKNELIVSAYSWIGDTNKIEWIINNVLEVPSSKYFYDKVSLKILLNDTISSTVKTSDLIVFENPCFSKILPASSLDIG